MPVWLHVLALIGLVGFFGASLVLLASVVGGTSPWLALLVMFYFLAVAKLAEPLVVLRMPRALERLRPWELDGGFLRRIGVLGFGRVLRGTPLRHLNARVYFGEAGAEPRRVRAQAASAEASHFWAAVLLTPYIAVVAAAGRWRVAAWLCLAQALVNVYPILHLRHVRGRLDRALARLGGGRRSGTPARRGAGGP